MLRVCRSRSGIVVFWLPTCQAEPTAGKARRPTRMIERPRNLDYESWGLLGLRAFRIEPCQLAPQLFSFGFLLFQTPL